jgi:RimJ/RimL family protein N-acetyltransferase
MTTSTPQLPLSTATFTSTSRPPLPLTPQTSAAYFQSSRLLFRAVEESDSALIHRIESDPTDSLFANGGIQKAKNVKRTDQQRDWLMGKDPEVILGVVVCLIPEPAVAVTTSAPVTEGAGGAAGKAAPEPVPVPIGTLSLHSCYGPPNRGGILGVSIMRDYRGKGYGAEAIRWITTWGFRAANLHRIQVDYFSWNQVSGVMVSCDGVL